MPIREYDVDLIDLPEWTRKALVGLVCLVGSG